MSEKPKDGSGLYHLGGGRYIGVDTAICPDMHTECEFEKLPDGTIRVVDIRHYPPTRSD